MPTIQQQIEAWRSRLLDVSLRNRLLHAYVQLPGQSASIQAAVRLIAPPVDRLFDLLVCQRRRLPFVPHTPSDAHLASLAWDGPATSDTIRLDKLSEALPGAALMSDLAPDELEHKLYTMRLRARTTLAEQGVNTLFVALGFLEWCAPDTPEQLVLAPLLLLPVELQRTPLGAEYALRLIDDEMVLNPTLAYKLRQDYGLILPELPEDTDELDIKQFFADIEQIITGSAGWQVVPAATLGLFSFLKLLMYDELARAADTIATHPILTVLAGEASPPDLPDIAAHDSRPPEQVYQVLDADASQQEAIAAARAGASFVLQGPPGTGKSQTIANIIAECLADGKRVLFVSEKMAALQVVSDRLRQCGLSEFCLDLHSHKTSKRAVLTALGAALESGDLPGNVDFPYHELSAIRTQLNGYAHALHTPHGSLRLTAQTVYTRLSSLQDAPACDAPLGDPAAYLPEQMGAIDVVLRQLDARRPLLQSLPANPWRGCTSTVGSFEERGRIRNQLRSLLGALKELLKTATLVAEMCELPPPDGLNATYTLAELVALLRAPAAHKIWLNEDTHKIQHLQFDIASARQRYAALRELEAQLGQRYDVGSIIDTDTKVLSLDIDGLLIRFTRRYRTWLRYVQPQFYRDRHELQARLQPGMIISYAAALDDLRLIRELRTAYQRLEELVPSIATQSGALFAGRRTDWDMLEAVCAWTLRMQTLPLAQPLPAVVYTIVALDSAEREAFLAPAHKLEAALAQLEAELVAFGKLFPPPAGLADTFADLLPPDDRWPISSVAADRSQPPENARGATDDGQPLINTTLAASANLKSPAHLLDHMADLDAWWEFCALRRQAEPLAIAPYLDQLSNAVPAATQPWRSFHKRFCQLWLDTAEQTFPELRSFQRDSHEELIARFRQLDAGQLGAAQTRLRRRLAGRRPTSVQAAPAGSELAILRRELQKQRRHKPIRQLLGEIPTLLGQLKPCLLMSPLSVSQFLDPDRIQFDLVVFDEASQIRTEDAIGAIMRSQALVVVGDSKQLPPTSFFVASVDGDDNEADTDAPATFESILDACTAVGLPTRMLRWHYRSRHEGLIAFSNEHFYDGRLVTFPLATAASANGVTFEHVADGVYDRRGTRTNLVEARRVADLVCAHVRTTPARSLGVVAFSQAQQLAILREVEQRAADADLAVLFDEERAEPFFVKNLENVQGDERDVMFFSIGYGRDARGNLSLNFGPLNQQGGERRLNVAITRARDQVHVVTSLLPDDIDLWRTKQPGPRLLRAYLEYAQRGGPDTQRATSERPARRHTASAAPPPDFPRLEDMLAQELVQRGLHIERQIGHSAFRIDIAIRDPRDPTRYLLGIECDGDDYRNTPTARDRERLREHVLVQFGWHIHRVWSAAWLQDAKAEMGRILDFLGGPMLH